MTDAIEAPRSADLPFVDELAAEVAAPAAVAYLAATRRMARSFEGRGARVFSGFLRCVHRGNSFAVPPSVGQEGNGFRVARVDAPNALILEGAHRFATYRLSFFVDPISDSRSRVRARTDALFPGIQGALYRALVIGSSGHRRIVRRMLESISRQAERAQ
jgi:hypothetical protein